MIHDFYLRCALALGSKWWRVKKSLRPQEVCNLMELPALTDVWRVIGWWDSGWVTDDSAVWLKGTQWLGFQAEWGVFCLSSDVHVQAGAPESSGHLTGTWRQALVWVEFRFVLLCFSFCLSWFFSPSVPGFLVWCLSVTCHRFEITSSLSALSDIIA